MVSCPEVSTKLNLQATRCEIRKTAREILEMAPDENLRESVEKITREVEEDYEFDESFVRLSKVGSKLYIEIDYVVGDEARVRDVAGFDQVREALHLKLAEVEWSKWLTVSFTADRKWAL